MKKKYAIIIVIVLVGLLIGGCIIYYTIPISKIYDVPVEYARIDYENRGGIQKYNTLSENTKNEFIQVFNNSKLKHSIKKIPNPIQYKLYDFEIVLFQEFFPENEYSIFRIDINFFHDFNPKILSNVEQKKELENYPTFMPNDNWTAFVTIYTKHGASNYRFVNESDIEQLVSIIKNSSITT